ncbi:MAG: LamG domain-containing protein [Acidobacteria bacterium]|nr:LamG domain-containing protein [Acidobacteriota bacterium]
MRLHDNQRTGNRQAPHLTSPREPAPQPSPAACPSEITGLTAYWSADGNAQDTSGNLSGINVGGVTFEEGKRGRAFKFNGGGNYVSIPQKVHQAQGGTLELWFNWDGTNASQAQAITGSFGGGTHAAPGLYVWGGGVFSFYGGAERYTNVLVTPGQWNHAAVTYDAAHNVKAYVNGALVNEYTASDPNPFFDELQIGKCTNCTFPGFNGLVDEPSSWFRARARRSTSTGARGKRRSNSKSPPTASSPAVPTPWPRRVRAPPSPSRTSSSSATRPPSLGHTGSTVTSSAARCGPSSSPASLCP